MSNDYHFTTRWQFEAQIEEVADILNDGPGLPRWWPSVYLDVQELEHGDENGVGKVISLYTKGWLPYTLSWMGRVTAANYPYGFTIDVRGDFVGRGVWTFEQNGKFVSVTYDWKVRAYKPLLKKLSFIMRPIFAMNHRWAMEKGEESMRLELARRRSKSPLELASIASPSGPTWAWLVRNNKR
jgi:hypothetical protein